MKARSSNSVEIRASRWLAYAGAGAATALVGTHAAEAEIHYSGKVEFTFQPNDNKVMNFPLDQPGDSLVFRHSTFNRVGAAGFKAEGLVKGAFLGVYSVFSYAYVSRLKGHGRYISEGPFTSFAGSGLDFGIMVDGNGGSHGIGKWKKQGTDFVGFRFNNGAGFQYGWARVRMQGQNANFAYTVIDYAYADPGEPIKAGQRSSALTNAPAEGSLGLLAAGAAGLVAWRQSRRRRPAV